MNAGPSQSQSSAPCKALAVARPPPPDVLCQRQQGGRPRAQRPAALAAGRARAATTPSGHTNTGPMRCMRCVFPIQSVILPNTRAGPPEQRRSPPPPPPPPPFPPPRGNSVLGGTARVGRLPASGPPVRVWLGSPAAVCGRPRPPRFFVRLLTCNGHADGPRGQVARVAETGWCGQTAPRCLLADPRVGCTRPFLWTSGQRQPPARWQHPLVTCWGGPQQPPQPPPPPTARTPARLSSPLV